MSTFPIGSSVFLQNLKSEQYNGKKGIVRSTLDPMSGRQEVYVIELEKSMAIKPDNIKYEPRELSSLSVSDMKGLLLLSSKKENEPDEWQGLDRDSLQKMVAEITTNPDEIASLVAKANDTKSKPNNTNGSFTSEQLKQATDRMSQMNPAQLRQQAATMKAMGPAALRNMNPQMAHMTDEQINMAISQMEAMASNPEMMKMATEQMKGMGEDELRQAMNQSASSALPRASVPSTNNPGTATMNDTIKNMSSDQFKEASQKISSLSPEQLKQQANMLKNMPMETLRKTNPHMANMSEEQIKLAISQMETMANNPEMMKMASEQMQNMDEKQFEQVKQMFQGGVGASSNGTTASSSGDQLNMADLAADPSKMMESLLSNPEQLSSMIKTMKQNPDLIKSMMRTQMGMKDNNSKNGVDPRAEQIEKAIDQFANMSDEQLDKYIRYANKAQSVFQPMLSSFNKAKTVLGVSSRTMVLLINLIIFGGIAMLVFWFRSRGQSSAVDLDIIAELQSDEPPSVVSGHDESEF